MIIERPGEKTALIEIKSSAQVADSQAHKLESFYKDFSSAEAFVLSRETMSRKIGSVSLLPWEQGLTELGL